jgi:protease-4
MDPTQLPFPARLSRIVDREKCMLRRSVVPLFVCLAVSTVRAADEPTISVAQIRLAGSMDEGPVSDDPLFGSLGENFKSKLDRIRKAKDDPAIGGLLLQLDDLGIGWGKLDELRRALADFRRSGKKAYAYLEAGDGHDYLAASACDQIFMPESGALSLTGVRMGTMFYKDLFDKLGVKADMIQMGDFKGAAEPFTRSSMSKEFRQQLETVLDDYYEKGLVEAIVQSRSGKKWTAEQVKKLIDQGPYTAHGAAAAGLIDHLAYADELRDKLKTDLKAGQIKMVRNYGKEEGEKLDFSNPLALFKLFSPSKPGLSSKGTRVAVIYATGAIVTGKGGRSLLSGEVCGSTAIIEAIRQAEQDKSVKAIVLRVDSPGGSALASDLIWHELRRCKKPVVASMGNTAASGGYYISMAAQKIYADPGTLTGSIGVVGGKIVLGGLEEKVGLKTEILSRGVNANVYSSTTPFSEGEKTVVRKMMHDIYEQFVGKALDGRHRAGQKMERADLDRLAGGRIWTGRQAKSNGLIDELGTLEDAVVSAKTLAGLAKDEKVDWLLLPKPKTLLDLLQDFKGDARAPLSSAALLRDFPGMGDKLKTLDALLRLRGEMVWMTMPCRIDVR